MKGFEVLCLVLFGLVLSIHCTPLAVIVDKNGGEEPAEFFPGPENREVPERPFARFPPTFDDFDRDDSFEDDDAFGGYNPFRRMSFLEYFRRIQENMRRMWENTRRQMWAARNGTVFNFDRFPPDYNNSTFTTKVVNGSIISVNETIKKHQGNDSSYFFMWKVVQVKPENATGQDEPDVEVPSDVAPEVSTNLPSSFPEIESTHEAELDSSTSKDESNDIPKIV